MAGRVAGAGYRTWAPAFVDDQHAQARIGQVLGGEVVCRAHRGQRVPGRTVEQVLRPVGAGVAGVFGQGPAVLTRHVAVQGTDVLAGLGAGLDSGEMHSQA